MSKFRNIKLSKKAIIEVQFNWIFVLIAGSLILLFFMAIVNWQRGVAETNLAKEVRNNLGTIITHSKLGTEESRENAIRTPNKKINFICEDAASSFNIEKTGVSESLATTVLFSPDYIQGREMITYAMKWKSPFFITNFLYITSPQVRYVLVKDNANAEIAAKAQEFYDLLPEKISKEIIDLSEIKDIKDKNNYKIKFVFFNLAAETIDVSAARDFFDKVKNQITAVNIKNEEVAFYTYIRDARAFQQTEKYNFLEMPSLIGAIFAENGKNYKCNMEKAFRKYKIMSYLYGERNKLLSDDAANCPHYANLDALNDAITGALNNDLESSYIATIKIKANELVEKNSNAEAASCPLIY